MKVSIAYVGDSAQTLKEIEVEPGTTLIQAYQKTHLWDIHSELKDEKVTLGVHGRVRSETSVLVEGERIEVYRQRLCRPGRLPR